MVFVKGIEIGVGIPKICVPITEKDQEAIYTQARKIVNSEADIVEWRCDLFDQWNNMDVVKEVLTNLSEILGEKAFLFTFRSKEEGGNSDISGDQYIALNKMVMDSGLIDLIDIECCVSEYIALELIPHAHEKGIYVIGSSHDFQKTPRPEEMMYRLSYMEKMGVDIGKIAVMPKSRQDVANLMELTRQASQELMIPVISMAMGKTGALTRVIGEFTGSCVTFGCLGQESAPGQINVHLLHQFLTVLHG